MKLPFSYLALKKTEGMGEERDELRVRTEVGRLTLAFFTGWVLQDGKFRCHRHA